MKEIHAKIYYMNIYEETNIMFNSKKQAFCLRNIKSFSRRKVKNIKINNS